MKKHLSLWTAAILLISMFVWFTACQKESAVTEPEFTNQSAGDRSPGDSKVYPPNAHPFGKSITQWTVDWMKEFTTDDCDHNGWLNPDYILFHQEGPVYFMAGLSTPGASANVTVPHGKAILFPLVNFLNDYPCPDPNFKPDPGQSMESFLRDGNDNFWGITDLMENITNTTVTIDGSQVSNVSNYQFVTNLFTFTGNLDLATTCFFDPCITGEPQSGVGGGYYIMLKPLSKGTHTVHYTSELPWGEQDATFYITVE